MKSERKHTKLADYYQEELDALRAESAIFADQHPEIANTLGMEQGGRPDPQVELLLQSFAFLSGRLRHQVDIDKARIPNALADSLYPHLGAPVPSMLVAQFGDIHASTLLARGQSISTPALSDSGQQIDCRFRTCCDTRLLPLEVTGVSLHAPDSVTLTPTGTQIQSVLLVQIAKPAAARLVKLEAPVLRFFIDTEAVPAAFKLYELLSLNLLGLCLNVPASATAPASQHLIAPRRMHWLGYEEDDAVLMNRQATPPGYRLLQEYFAFPHKFLFFELALPELPPDSGNFELLFAFDVPFEAGATFKPEALRLNCVPLVNLFLQHIEPIKLDYTEYEFRLVADREQHRYKEIYDLEHLYSIRSDGSMRTIEPYFGLDELTGASRPDYFYMARRERGEASNVAGGEYFVSFLDCRFDMTMLMDEVIGGTALCTNRRLPEQLRIGAAMQFDGPGPDVSIHSVTRPTPHEMPPQIGQRPWALVSQLALNHLSLADGPAALHALQEMLRLHAGPNRTLALRQIAGIEQIECKIVMRHLHHAKGHGVIRATRVHLKLDRYKFPGASPVLFWNVLRHFFALYVSVNNLVENSFATNDCAANDFDRPSLEGAQWIL